MRNIGYDQFSLFEGSCDFVLCIFYLDDFGNVRAQHLEQNIFTTWGDRIKVSGICFLKI